MKKLELQKLSTDILKKKEKGHKTMIGVFIPIIIALIFFVARDYLNGEEVDMATVTIIICSFGGMFSVIPELRKVQEVLQERN